MVMEDLEAPHHMLLMRYFMAQGLAHGQPLLFASPLPSPKSFLGTLPGLATGEEQKKSSRGGPEAQVGGIFCKLLLSLSWHGEICQFSKLEAWLGIDRQTTVINL